MTSLLIMSQPCLFGTNFHSAPRVTSKIQAFVMAHEVPNLASTKPLQPLLPPLPEPSHCYSDKGSTNPYFYSQPRFLSAPKALRVFLAPPAMNSAMAPQFPSLFKLLGILNYTTLVASSPRNPVGPLSAPVSAWDTLFLLLASTHCNDPFTCLVFHQTKSYLWEARGFWFCSKNYVWSWNHIL